MSNTVSEMVDWYTHHETTESLGYNPNGMCLRIAHEARAVGALYPSAFAAQHATPEAHRVYKVADLRRGMDLFFDDPNDSNPFGHIVGMVGRAKGVDKNDLNGVLVRTNSVVSGRIVVVRATYFKTHWGDDFQFGTDWLNGQVLDLNWVDKPEPRKQPKADPTKKVSVRAVRQVIHQLEDQLNQVKGSGHPRVVNALTRDITTLRQSIKQFS